jgi:FdhE protein
MSLTPLDAWLAGHSYLQPLAQFAARIDDALARVETPRAAIPDWNGYAEDFRTGVPLLSSTEAGVDLEPAGGMTVALVERLSADAPAGALMADIRPLAAQLRRLDEAPRRVAAWLLGDEAPALPASGLLRYVAWRAAARYLAPVVEAYGRWRDEERWLRRYCPTCGSAPAMAQLVGAESGRVRLLCCGACGTRWRYVRTACPFCENDAQRLAVVTVEGQAGLRLDYCESCRGYLKTYDGQGQEAVLLSDWTSLHLDLVARDRGLQRLAGSLYDLGSAVAPEALQGGLLPSR